MLRNHAAGINRLRRLPVPGEAVYPTAVNAEHMASLGIIGGKIHPLGIWQGKGTVKMENRDEFYKKVLTSGHLRDII